MSGLRCYRRVADLPAVPELAVIMTPPATVPGLIDDLGRRGCETLLTRFYRPANADDGPDAFVDRNEGYRRLDRPVPFHRMQVRVTDPSRRCRRHAEPEG